MPTARQIIRGTLGFHLNVLSPGEAEDADLFNRCLEGLNSLVDEINGGKTMLWQQVLSSGFVSGASGALGTAWTSVPSGTTILDAYLVSGGQDTRLTPITFETYAAIPDKSFTGEPFQWAQDGAGDVYFWPATSGITQIKIRHQQAASDFADLDTNYIMPAGYKSALQAMLADLLASGLIGGLPDAVVRAARSARRRLKSGIEPEIINPGYRGGCFFLTQ